jgi:hypothetical protein
MNIRLAASNHKSCLGNRRDFRFTLGRLKRRLDTLKVLKRESDFVHSLASQMLRNTVEYVEAVEREIALIWTIPK